MALGYLISPVIQIEDINGKPLVGGRVRVYRHGTQIPYITQKDWSGDMNPAEVILDAKGMCILIAEDDNLYDVYCEDSNYVPQWSRLNVAVGGGTGGGSGVVITSEDGSVTITRDGDMVDLSVAEPVPSAIVAESETRVSNGQFIFTSDPINITGDDISLADSQITCKKRWYHYDATVLLDWQGTQENHVAELTISGPDCYEKVSFDLSFPHQEWITLSADYQIQHSGDNISLGISGMPDSGMYARVTNASVHTIVGRITGNGGIEYEAGDGILIDDNDVISVDFDRAQEKLTAGENITIDSDGVISASCIGDAPFDETTYARKDGEWVEISGVSDTERTEWNAAYSHSNTEGNPHGTTIEDIEGLRSELTALENADADLSGRIDTEVSERQESDINLQSQIDSITSKSDVVDVVGTYADLMAYDTSTLGDNDVIKVLEDETEDDAESYYRWNLASETWTYIGSHGPFVTPAEMETALNEKVDKVTGKGLSTNDFTNAAKSITDNIFLATYNSTSYADIKAAYDAGKTILCRFTDSSHTVRVATFDRLTNSTTSTSYAYFASVTKTDAYELVASKTRYGTTTTWSNTHKTWGALAEKDNVTNADISGTIQDAHIASASTWNGKQDAIDDLSTIRSNASNGQTAYGWGDHATWTPSFSQASSRANLNGSGETITTIFGKIKKWFADLKTVAFTGSYNDLTNKPTIPPAITIDSAMSSSSTNPVQNKVIKSVTDALSTRIDNIPSYGGFPVVEIVIGNTLPSNPQNYIYKKTTGGITELFTFIKVDETHDSGRIYLQKLYSDVANLDGNGVHVLYIEYNKSTRTITNFVLSTVERFMYREILYITKDWSGGSINFDELDEVKRAYENHIPCILHAKIRPIDSPDVIERDFNLGFYIQMNDVESPVFSACMPDQYANLVMYVLYLDEDGIPICYKSSLLDTSVLPIPSQLIADSAVTTDKIDNYAVTGIKIANSAVTNDKMANEAVTRSKIAQGAVSTDKQSCAAFFWTVSSHYNGGQRDFMELIGPYGATGSDGSDVNSFNSMLAADVNTVRYSDVMVFFDVTYSSSSDKAYAYCNMQSLPKFTLFRVKISCKGNGLKIRFRTNSSTEALSQITVNNNRATNTSHDYTLDPNGKEDICFFRGEDSGGKCSLYLTSTWTT